MSVFPRGQAPAILVLESGRVFRGQALGAHGKTFGEVVFNTSMTGYQEILTDPSYTGQIVVMTASHIGNTGVNAVDIESERPAAAGFAVRDACTHASNFRAQDELDSYLRSHGVVGITGIDTRALTRAIRDGGAQRGLIASGAAAAGDIQVLVREVQAAPTMDGQDLASKVTCPAVYEWVDPPDAGRAHAAYLPAAAEPVFHVVAYDFGIKHYILRQLRAIGCRVTVVPAQTSAKDALALAPDGVFLSNGPGDPAAVTYAIAAVRELADSGPPLFGICLGHQLLALALGARTYKLPFGHHGGNHPVKDLATGKVEITAQNHGFAVDADTLPSGVTCTHINLYDQTVEGLRVEGRPVFSVQYHPEASPGPHDAGYLFGRFQNLLRHAR